MAMRATATTCAATRLEKSLMDIARQPVWKVREAAMILRCSQTTLRRELKRGAITGVRIGNEWRIPADQFSALARAARSANGTSAIVIEATATQHTVRLSLLGRSQIYVDDIRLDELESSNRRSQVIQLLALHRSGLSGERLACSLNMANHQYEDESLNSHYVRNLVWGTRTQARKKTGWGGIIQSPTKGGAGLLHYRLPDNTICDLWEFEDKLDEADQIMAGQSAVLSASGEATGEDEERCVARTRNSAIKRAAALREEALQLYKGELCEGSNNGCIAQAARMLEERYVRAALQQGDYWRTQALSAAALKRQGQEMHIAHNSSLLPIGGLLRIPTPDTPPLPSHTHPEVQTIWREALRNYERVLRVDNYHEEAYVHAMRCYAHLGNARGVDQIFTRCQDVLHADLRRSPGEDAVRAYMECKTMASLSVSSVAAQMLQQLEASTCP